MKSRTQPTPRHQGPARANATAASPRSAQAYPGSETFGEWSPGETNAHGKVEPSSAPGATAARPSAHSRTDSSQRNVGSVEDPYRHTQNVKRMIGELIDHLREDVAKIQEPKAKALFETSAEVLGGLMKAFDDYEKKNEDAWRK